MPLLHPEGYHAVQIIVMVHGCHSWVGLLTGSLLWKVKCCILVPWKLVPRKEGLKSYPSGIFWVLSEVHGLFNNRDSPSISGRQKRATVLVYNDLEVSWTAVTSYLKANFSCLELLTLLDNLWLLWGASSAQMGNFYLYSNCICMHTLTCIVGIFGRWIIADSLW